MEGKSPELYDLRNDERVFSNLADHLPVRTGYYQYLLTLKLKQQQDMAKLVDKRPGKQAVAGQVPGTLPGKVKDNLRKLGYLD